MVNGFIYGLIFHEEFLLPPCDMLPWIRARPGFLSGAGTGLSRSPAPRKRSATTQTTYTALRRGSCCTLCSRLRPQLRRWKAASEAPQRGRGRRMRFCYSQLELAALQEVGGDAQKNDILPGRPRQSSPWTRQRRGEVRGICGSAGLAGEWTGWVWGFSP